MGIADLGVVYSSTTGFEMGAFGTPVVCGNYFHYNGKGFTHDPRTVEEYFEIIDRILAAPSEYRLSPKQMDLALSYLDIFFNQFPVPFPWGTADFWRELNEWPIGRVISAEGDARFGPSFDRLVGRV